MHLNIGNVTYITFNLYVCILLLPIWEVVVGVKLYFGEKLYAMHKTDLLLKIIGIVLMLHIHVLGDGWCVCDSNLLFQVFVLHSPPFNPFNYNPCYNVCLCSDM